jgi:uncharacterized protein
MSLLAALAASAVLFASGSAGVYPVRPDSPVLDLADVFPTKDEALLAQRLAKFYHATGNALVVVTVTSLDGRTIDDYANVLYTKWGIGDAKTSRGVLILLAPGDRQARIEVGCGLESTVTDGFAADVMHNTMVPQYKQGRYEAGTLAAVDALIGRLEAPEAANDNGPVSAICRARQGAAR